MRKVKILSILTALILGVSPVAHAGFLDGENSDLTDLMILEELFEDNDTDFEDLIRLILIENLFEDDGDSEDLEEPEEPAEPTPTPATPKPAVTPVTPAPTTPTTPTPPAPVTAKPDPATQTVKVALIDLDSDGSVGCGYNLAFVDKTVPATSTPFVSSIEQLLAEKNPSEHYSALRNSSLTLDRAAIENGTATIELSGNLSLGGVCDNPRLTTQIEETARQFDAVENVEVTLNGENLDDVLSQQ